VSDIKVAESYITDYEFIFVGKLSIELTKALGDMGQVVSRKFYVLNTFLDKLREYTKNLSNFTPFNGTKFYWKCFLVEIANFSNECTSTDNSTSGLFVYVYSGVWRYLTKSGLQLTSFYL